MGYDVYHSVKAAKPQDEKFSQMKTAAENLMKLNLEVPDEILKYFGVECEGEIDFAIDGVVEDVTSASFVKYISSEEDSRDEYYEIKLNEIPKDYDKLIFHISHSY